MNFAKESLILSPPERVFAFHELPDAIERLIPPWQKVKVIQKADISVIGSRAIFDIKVLGPFTERWVAEHTVYDPPRVFEDVQISGPFKTWRHRHIVQPHPAGAILSDEIAYSPPFGWMGEMAIKYIGLSDLERMFDYRHQITKEWCESGS